MAAAVATHAVGILTAADDQIRYRCFSPLFRDYHITLRRITSRPSEPDAIHLPAPPPNPMMLSYKRMAKLSPQLRHDLLTSCDSHLIVSERLRYRTTVSPRLPEPGSRVAAERGRHIPQYLWHDWLVRFRPHRGAYADTMAVDLPAALLIPGNPVRNIHATRELNPWRPNISIALGAIAQRYPDILTAICLLADYLDTHGAPIDYRRRRTTFTDVTLSDQQWKTICARADAHPGKQTRRLNARRYIFALLTGADLSSRRHQLAFANAFDRQTYLAFQQIMPSPLRHELRAHAAGLLSGTGIDEPLTWSPPGHIVAGLTLPGRDPADIDMTALHQAIIVEGLSITAAAAKLGVSFEHIRYATQFLHRTQSTNPTSQPLRTRKKRPRAEDVLTADFFQREHIDAGKDLPTLCAETGYAGPTLRRYAHRAGIELVNAQRAPAKVPRARKLDSIDPDWLREQVITFNRTNGGIGAELGLSHETIRKYRKELGLPGHAFGSDGHVVTNMRHPGLPRDIRRAIEGQRTGWQRLQRFQRMMAYPSMNSAAHGLGLHTQNLNLQLQRLERDIGAKLLQRAPHRCAPMTPTKRGRRVLDHLAQPHIRDLLERYANSNTRPKIGPHMNSGRRHR